MAFWLAPLRLYRCLSLSSLKKFLPKQIIIVVDDDDDNNSKMDEKNDIDNSRSRYKMLRCGALTRPLLSLCVPLSAIA